MRKFSPWQAAASVAIAAAANIAWAADGGAATPSTEGSGQATPKMERDPAHTGPSPSDSTEANTSPGLRLDDRMNAPGQTRENPLARKRGRGADASSSAGGTDTDSANRATPATPSNPAAPPVLPIPATPSLPSPHDDPGNPVTPTSAR
jgi:hypothetical protein